MQENLIDEDLSRKILEIGLDVCIAEAVSRILYSCIAERCGINEKFDNVYLSLLLLRHIKDLHNKCNYCEKMLNL